MHLLKSIPDQCRCSHVRESPRKTCRAGQNQPAHPATRQGNPVIRCSCHLCRHKFSPRWPTLPITHTHTFARSLPHTRTDCLQDHPGSIDGRQSTQITRAASVEGGSRELRLSNPNSLLINVEGSSCARQQRPMVRTIEQAYHRSRIPHFCCCSSSFPDLPPLPRPPACPAEISRQTSQPASQTGSQTGRPWRRSAAGRGGVKIDGHRRR